MTNAKEIPLFMVERELPSYTVLENGCWRTKLAARKNGYCCVGRHFKDKKYTVLAHRLFYTKLIGVIPKGLTLDHLCRNRFCVNPKHLEPVTYKENWLRGSSQSAKSTRSNKCKNGHTYTQETTYVQTTGKRTCRICIRKREKIYYKNRNAKNK